MRREKLNLFTFYAIAGIVFIISIIELQFFLQASNNRVTEVQIENSKREANQLSYLIGTQISDGIPKETAIKNLQKTIQKTNTKTSYISLINYSGKQISYLEKKKADGLLNLEEASSFGLNNNGTNESLNKFVNILTIMLNNAKRAKRMDKVRAWKEYYEFKNKVMLLKSIYDAYGTLIVGKDLDYTYGITTHKSQGSTYDDIYVNVRAILYDKDGLPMTDTNLRNRLLYVAISRARRIAHVLI
jgi:hypothetical protein